MAATTPLVIGILIMAVGLIVVLWNDIHDVNECLEAAQPTGRPCSSREGSMLVGAVVVVIGAIMAIPGSLARERR